tara:strand:+ start:1401 stop:1667 length:267 start_codon:yes stop_codon:yes gene_type:complete
LGYEAGYRHDADGGVGVHDLVGAAALSEVSVREANPVSPPTSTQFNLFRIYFGGGGINEIAHSDQPTPRFYSRDRIVEEHPQVEPLGP